MTDIQEVDEVAEYEAQQALIARNKQIVSSMEEAGVTTFEAIQEDYFGFDETYTVKLPDGKSWIAHSALNEGARRKYMNSQNRELKVQKVTGDAIMKIASGEERLALLQQAITGWNLVTKNKKTGEIEPIVFNLPNLNKFLDSASPAIIDLIEKDVRNRNSWLMGDVTVEDIDKQIEELQEMREKKVKEAEGNDS